MPRPTGSGATSIRVEAGDEQHRPRLFIGRALWQQIGSPARLTVKRDLDGRVVLRPADGSMGYAVAATGNGMPRVTIGTPLLDSLQLLAGDYPAAIVDGAIVTAP